MRGRVSGGRTEPSGVSIPPACRGGICRGRSACSSGPSFPLWAEAAATGHRDVSLAFDLPGAVDSAPLGDIFARGPVAGSRQLESAPFARFHGHRTNGGNTDAQRLADVGT